MADVPEFDPSKPFEAVGGSAPEFDPSKPFEPVGEKPDATWGETALDVAKQVPSALATVPELIATGPAQLMGLAGRGLNAIGLGGNAEAEANQQKMRELAAQQGGSKGIAQYLPEAQTPAGEFTRTATQFAGTAALAPGNIGRNILTGVAGGLTSEAGGQLARKYVPEIPGAETAARIVGGVGGIAAGAGAQAAARGIFSPNVSDSANAQMARALARDGDTSEALLQRLEQARQVRPEATLADVGGENVRGIVERVAQTPGAGRNTVIPALTERQQQQMTRVSDDLVAATGTKQTAFRAIQDTMESRQAAATPLYKQAYADGDFAVFSPTLERLTSAPAVRGAMSRAVSAWRNQAIADGYGAMNPSATVERGGQLQFLSGKVPVFPNIQFWDYTKRMLDDDISKAIRAGATNKARALTKLTTVLRDDLDNMVPSYKAARDAWAGPSRFMDAIEEGKSILNRNITSEELTHNLAALSDSEREAFRIGAVSALRQRMAANPAKMGDMTTLLRSPDMRAKLTAMMPTPEAAERFGRALDYEVRSSELVKGSLAGSQTAYRLAAQNEAENVVGEILMHGMTHGTSIGFARKVWNTLGKPVRDTLRARSDAVLAELLTVPPPSVAKIAPPSGKTPWGITGRPGLYHVQGQENFKHGGRVTKSFRIKQ